jgi:DNA-binding MarR family transcriptional regulator
LTFEGEARFLSMMPPAEPSLGRTLEFLRLLWAVDQRLQAASKLMHTRFGVTGLQRMIIRVVGLKPEISISALTRILKTQKSALEAPLEGLAVQGAIIRKRDPMDAKGVLLSLGPKGQTIDAFRTGTVESKVEATIARFPDEKIAAALEVLAALARELEDA